MSDKDQIDQFACEVDKLVERVRSEYDMTYAAVVGVLQMKINSLCIEASESAEEDDNPD